MADAFFSDKKDQGFTGRTAGVEARQALCLDVPERVGIGADDGFGEKRQALKVRGASNTGGIKPKPCEQVTVIRHMGGRVLQEITQPLQLECREAISGPPLDLFHLAPQSHRVVALEALMHRKQ